ncbi:hypothetical protein SDRG_15566 [Saprolegnia diclina VS20]|uniref:Uncharacterized protein n=1 Tax=Saprolegnia diclina (strain VS20) TaxID=1156394 RepID=T0PWL4_SAPDV|nr:hypothetical protein SDRG_15566 [Saprolegnia diclina VS20]EQC26626.1 hypothetical protein SDRG_15566 [Saprolegnia diclina VS20]|eukprot:XP_008619964.1 hypothetical protein SDRG_15566 [Saprolegnia diclina VS20]
MVPSAAAIRAWVFLAGGLVALYLLGPLLQAVFMRIVVVAVCILLLAAVLNPTDLSFAHWAATQVNQGRVVPSSWFKSIVESVLPGPDEATWRWTRYNLVFLSLVHVAAIERDAIGVFGLWFWADSSYVLASLCRTYRPWAAALTNGGQASGTQAHSSAAVAPASEHECRSLAVEKRKSGQFAQAYEKYMEAADLSINPLDQALYRLEAARCLTKTLSLAKSKSISGTCIKIERLYRDSCNSLVGHGEFHVAGVALIELAALLTEWTVPLSASSDTETTETLEHISKAYLEAALVLEAADTVVDRRLAFQSSLAAGNLFADAAMSNDTARDMWLAAAEAQFRSVGLAHIEINVSWAKDAFACAVFTLLGRADVPGAQAAYIAFDELCMAHLTPVDHLLLSVFAAYDKWQVDMLHAGVAAYATSADRLLGWQERALSQVTTLLSAPTTDLR